MEHKNDSGNGSKTFRTQIYKTNTLIDLSRAAKQRLKWMLHFEKFRSARLTCRHFGISPDTFYLWKKRYSPDDPQTLEDDPATRKPHTLRHSRHQIAQLETIQALKNRNPKMGKLKIARIIEKTGYAISSSTVGRLLKKHA